MSYSDFDHVWTKFVKGDSDERIPGPLKGYPKKDPVWQYVMLHDPSIVTSN